MHLILNVSEGSSDCPILSPCIFGLRKKRAGQGNSSTGFVACLRLVAYYVAAEGGLRWYATQMLLSVTVATMHLQTELHMLTSQGSFPQQWYAFRKQK